MYGLPQYKEHDQEKLLAFMRSNSFAMLCCNADGYPAVTHLPFDVTEQNGKIILGGHMMRKTDHHLALEKNDQALVVFTGPQCYISASWYSQQNAASTWNYMTVHAKGKITFLDDEGTYNMVQSITEKYESNTSPAAFNQLSEAYIQPLIKAIIGFIIEVDTLNNVFKLSQNHDKPSQENIIHQLTSLGDFNSLAIAAEMKSRL